MAKNPEKKWKKQLKDARALVESNALDHRFFHNLNAMKQAFAAKVQQRTLSIKIDALFTRYDNTIQQAAEKASELLCQAQIDFNEALETGKLGKESELFFTCVQTISALFRILNFNDNDRAFIEQIEHRMKQKARIEDYSTIIKHFFIHNADTTLAAMTYVCDEFFEWRNKEGKQIIQTQKGEEIKINDESTLVENISETIRTMKDMMKHLHGKNNWFLGRTYVLQKEMGKQFPREISTFVEHLEHFFNKMAA